MGDGVLTALVIGVGATPDSAGLINPPLEEGPRPES